MVRRALHRKLLRDLASLRAQTVTTAILVACGVSLLVSAWSAFVSLRDARDRYYRDYSFAQLFGELKRAPLDLEPRLARVPWVQQVDARIVIDGLVDVPGQEEPAVGRFISVPSGRQPPLDRLYLRQGRLPEDSAETEVVVHEGFAQAQKLKLGDHLTALIQGRRERLLVVGIALSPEYVYALSPAAPLPDDRHFGILWIARHELERLAGMSSAFNSVAMTLGPGAPEGEVRRRIDELLRPYGNRGTYGRDRQASSMFVNDEIEQQRVSAIVNPLVFLGIAAFLIHIISSRLISLHRPQIATLKAVGYSDAAVSLHYLELVVLMMLAGALPGVAGGALLGRVLALSYQGFFRFPRLDFSVHAGAALLGIAAGVLPGALGAWGSISTVFRLAPAEAMRPPAPPAFRAGWLERLGLGRGLGARGRMVMRNLLFRPARLVLTILGMATALAVVVMSGAWNDMIAFLLDTQFGLVQREDLSVAFVDPLTVNALQELAGQTGVLAVEGYRIAPVRLRYLNRSRDLALTGWPEGARMRQRLDARLRPIPLPAEGVLLSRYFERSWGLRPGDRVEMELLEGKPRSISVPVAGFTDDLVGLSASIDIRALWRALDEQPDYNVAMLEADPRRIERLYVRLEEFPQVATVSLKAALERGFQETVGAIIRVSTLILVSFALAIAFGVIYNSIRVSYSERSWELASLRILGFSRESVFGMLLAEVATQVAISLVPGCLLGWGLTYLIMKLMHAETFEFPVVIRLATYAAAILVVLAAFALSGWGVRRMISRLSLSEALKARD